MSQTRKLSKLTVRNRPGAEGRITTGANVELLLDGEPLKGATYCKIELKTGKTAKVTVEYIAEIDAEVFAELGESEASDKTPFMRNGKHLAIYRLGSPFPMESVPKDSET
jgi:hypothetical protein